MTKALKLDDPNKKKPILTAGNMWMYALGIMGIQLGIGLVNSYQAEFFNKILGANLMIIAGIILAAKFISIIADFVIGNLIDRSRFKNGKMKPWILISAFPLAVFTMVSFITIDFQSDALKYIYIMVIVVLWNVSMTLADIPSQGMLALLSPDANERNNAAGLANTLKSIALACPGVIVTVICMLTGSTENGGTVSSTDYYITAGIMAGLGLIFQLLMYFKTRENVRSTVNSSMSFKDMFRELKSNKMILIVLITYLLGFGRNIGLGIAVQASTILIRDGIDLSFIGMGVLRGDSCSWLIGLTSAVSSMIIIVLNPMINRKLGEKKYFIVAGFFGFAVSLISFLMYALSPENGALRSLWAILVYQFFLGFSFGPNGYLPMVMTSDIVDYQEWKTGKRTEGTQFAILSMSNKLSNALSVSLGILFIGAIGYSASQYANAVDLDTAAQTTANVHAYITADMQTKTWAIYFLLPGLCMLASSIVMFWYKIDDKTKKQMRAELAERRAATAEADGIQSDNNDDIDGLTSVIAEAEEGIFATPDDADEYKNTDSVDVTDAPFEEITTDIADTQDDDK